MSTSTGNTKYGSGALQSNSTINGNNSAFGIAALGLSTEKWNTAVGAYSGFATTSGISNTSVGTNTLLHNTSGNYNTALGTAALCVNTLGTGNTAVGSNSLEYSTTGGNNTIIGTQTGGLIVTGSNNICLGYKAGTSASSGVDYSNCIVIGNNIFPTASAQAIIGDGTQTSMNLVCSTNPTMSGYALPLSTDASNKIATCAWVQTAVGGGGTSLIPLNNTWTGTNAFNNVAPITSTATQPASSDSSTKIPTTSWVQGAITSGSGAKMPLAGGTFTGTVYFTNPYPAVNYKRNTRWFYDNGAGLTYTPTQTISSNHDFIILQYNNACTIDLVNLNCDNDSYWQDGMRTVTITKSASVSGGFIVTVLPPAGYTCYDITNLSSLSLTIGAGVFSATYQILNIYWSPGATGTMYLISQA